MKYLIDLIYGKSQFSIVLNFFLSLIIGFFLKIPLSAAQTDFYIYPAEDLSLRTGAGYEYPIAHSSISFGTRVKIISVNDDKLWSKITTDDEKSGSSAGGLHAEQHFTYHRHLTPGDVLTAETKPGESWEKESKRAGVLKFSESITEYRDQNGELVVTARSVGVVTEKVIEQ